MNTPTTGISKLLDQLIRPLFDKHVRSTTIIDGFDLIRRLETYVENDYLKPTTHLCTFDITDSYAMLPKEESLDVLTEFLLQFCYRKVKGIPLDAIRKLARIASPKMCLSTKRNFIAKLSAVPWDQHLL